MFDAHYEPIMPVTQIEQVVEANKIASPSKIKLQAFAYMDQLEGWCSKEKAGVLIDLILKNRPESILEIGVWGGKSLVPMAYALKANGKGKIYGIDPWSNYESVQHVMNESNIAFWNYVDHESVMKGLISKIEQFDLKNQVELIRNTSAGATPMENIDMLHVDGNHSEQTSYFDVKKWVPHVRSGGVIIFDDMTWYENNTYTTARAVKWLNENCIKFAEFSDTCVWGIWIKP